MRAVLVVLGIAIFGIILSTLVNKPKDLTPLPQEREQAKRDAATAADAAKTSAPSAGTLPEPAFKPPAEGTIQAVIAIEGKGNIIVEMYPKAAPKTVSQVARLIKEGFYNGIVVHRVVPNFVVQAGNPVTKTKGADAPEEGTGGSGKTIPFEQTKLPNVRGSLAMALRSPQSDTADSQFFINLKYNSTLDNDYCVFGKVIEGMDVVEKVAKGDVIKSFSPR